MADLKFQTIEVQHLSAAHLDRTIALLDGESSVTGKLERVFITLSRSTYSGNTVSIHVQLATDSGKYELQTKEPGYLVQIADVLESDPDSQDSETGATS